MWHDNHVQKKQQQKDALEKHFQQLETSAIKPISNIMRRITNSEGTLWEKGEIVFSNPTYRWPTKTFEQGEFLNFKPHFPNQTDTIMKLMTEIDKHNEEVKLFRDKLTELITTKTKIPIKAVKTAEERPSIEAAVPTYLQQTLYNLTAIGLHEEAKATNYHDFRQAEIKRMTDTYWRLYTPGTLYASVTTKEEANLCKDALVELMNSEKLLIKMCAIYIDAKHLEEESRSLANLLDFICDQHDQYGKLLKREKGCAICKVIFE